MCLLNQTRAGGWKTSIPAITGGNEVAAKEIAGSQQRRSSHRSRSIDERYTLRQNCAGRRKALVSEVGEGHRPCGDKSQRVEVVDAGRKSHWISRDAGPQVRRRGGKP